MSTESNATPLQESISASLDALLRSIDAENADFFERVFEGEDLAAARSALADGKPDLFDTVFNYQLRKATSGFVLPALAGNRNLAFLFEKADFVESHLKHRFSEIEGSACCADKARTVMRALARHLADDKRAPIRFNYSQQITYHLPKTVLFEHGDILAFFASLINLYHGKIEPYASICRAQAAAKAD